MNNIKVPCLTNEQVKSLIEAADAVSLRFNAPVFLVGSAVKSERPNDIDIYIA